MLYTLMRTFRVLADSVSRSVTSNLLGASASSDSVRSRRARIFAGIEPLEERALMSTYYVSNSGNDNNKGTSSSSAWRSLGKVSSTHLNPGDEVLFEGGQSFGGTLNLYSDGGSSSNPFVIGSYGSGKATISSGQGDGIWVLNSTGVTIENLNIVGSPGNTGSQDGIRIENFTSNSVRSGFTINDCNVSGYAEGGIVFGSDSSSEGLNDVTIENNDVYDNVMNGIESYSVTTESNTNVTIDNNQVHNNYGDRTSNNTGNGIMLGGLNGATVQYNSAYDNGLTGGVGNVGIWTYSSNDVLVQYNQSYDNASVSWDDGDGFDFDADTSNSIMQYNFAADNDGGGLQLNQWHNDNDETGDIIRYNISQDNGRKNNYSGIDVWGKVLNAQIYNNTVYNTPAISGQTSDIRLSDNTITTLHPDNVRIANNIFVTTGGTPFIDFYSADLSGAQAIVFAGNVYYSYSGSANFVWGSKDYSSLASFQAGTGQEKLNGTDVGAYENPMLVDPGQGAPVSGAFSMAAFTAYDLESDTPILNVGVPLTSALGIAEPLTGNGGGKTIPGEDQHLIGDASPQSTPSSGSGSTTTTSGGGSTTTASGHIGQSYLSGTDIGNPNKGSNTISGSTNTITGGGSGVGGTSDSFRFASTTLTGNGQIVAQLTSVSNSSSSVEAGVMIRESSAADSPAVSLLLSPGNTASLLTRATTGGSTSKTSKGNSGDQWIKLVRVGNTFSAYISPNDSAWTLIGSTSVTMNATVSIGLAVSASSLKSTETAVFKNVAFTGSVTS